MTPERADLDGFSLLHPPLPAHLARLAQGPRRFVVTVDVEEDFDWAAPLSREGFRLDSLGELGVFQAFCERHGVRPTYLLDYPAAAAPATADALGGPLAAGRAAIGLQLHPWVTPPFEEPLTPRNSYAGNLPRALEREKMIALNELVRRRFGASPVLYRAGRYGAGPDTAELLREHGLAIDSSVRAYFDYRREGGPDFSAHGPAPWWVGGVRGAGGVLALPLTTIFTGRWHRRGARWFARFRRLPPARALAARLGLLERIPLTPEGVPLARAVAAVDQAIADGLPVLVFSFHSSSLRPGCTPYVRTAAQRDALYGWWAAMFAHLAARGLQCTTPEELTTALG